MKRLIVFLVVLLFVVTLISASCTPSSEETPAREETSTQTETTPEPQPAIIEKPAVGLSQLGVWQNIGPVIDGKTLCVNDLVCTEENGKIILYAGTGSPGLILRWFEETQSWSDIGYELPEFGWIGTLAVDPTDSQILYAGIGASRIAKTIDGGENWSLIDYSSQIEGELGRGPRSFAISNENPQAIYLGTNDGLLKSVDGGKTWELLDNGIATYGFIVWTVAINPNDNSILLAGGEDQSDTKRITENLVFNPDTRCWEDKNGGCKIAVEELREKYPHIPRLFYSDDAGESWTELTYHEGKRSFLPGCDYSFWHPMDIEFNPENSQNIYVGTEGCGLFYSQNGGKNWKKIQGEFSIVESIEFDPNNPKVIYEGDLNPKVIHHGKEGEAVVEYRGAVFESQNGGESWHRITTGLEPKHLIDLAISKDGSILYGSFLYSTCANLQSAGVWRLKLN